LEIFVGQGEFPQDPEVADIAFYSASYFTPSAFIKLFYRDLI
jgi:hypothetical protein